MLIRATDEQLLQMIINAINASKPMGMGFLHYREYEYTVSDFLKNQPISTFLNIDYYQGRMVKLYMEQVESPSMGVPATFKIIGTEAREDYQSWVHKYPTYEDLAKSAEGIEILE